MSRKFIVDGIDIENFQVDGSNDRVASNIFGIIQNQKRITGMCEKLNDIENKLVVEYYGFLIFLALKLNIYENIDELYIPYIEGIMRYCENKDLQRYSIKTIIGNTIKWYCRNEYKKSKCRKRRPTGGICSYDTISYCNKIQDINYQISLEKKAMDEVTVEQIVDNLDNQKQKKIVELLSVGYSKTDVKRKMNISNYDLMKNIEEIKIVMLDKSWRK